MIREQSLVTIITPCYNGAEFIDQYFESIINQTYPFIELIFVDDGSVDNTEKIAKSYRAKLENRGIRYTYVRQEHAGQAKAMNTGLRLMRGEFLTWPDSDDLLAPNSIELRVQFLKQNPQYNFVRSNGVFFDYQTKNTLNRVSNLDNRFHEDIFLDLILEETYCCCGCYMIRSKLVDQFYPDRHIMESSAGQNWQLLIPIAGNYLCGYIDQDLYHIAVRADSHSRQSKTYQQEINRLLELRNILENSIVISGRNEKDYQKIVDIKYLKIFFRTCIKYGEFEEAKKYYKKLKDAGEVTDIQQRLFLQTFHPRRYRVYDFVNRAKAKVKRDMMISKGNLKC